MFFHSPSLFYFIVICNGVQSLYWSHHLHLALPLPVFTTCTCAGIRSIISATWEITPILRPCICNRSKASIAMRRVSISSDPKPSSIKQRFHIHPVGDRKIKAQCQGERYRRKIPRPKGNGHYAPHPSYQDPPILPKLSVSGMRCSS